LPYEKVNAPARPRVCVIDSTEVGLAYARLDDCRFDVMGSLPALEQLTPRIASTYDAILVGCTERVLSSPAFRGRVQHLGRTAKLIAVVPSPTADAGARAAGLGFMGLVAREVPPRALERTVAAVRHGESAFPRGVMNALIHLVGRLSTGGLGGPTLTPRQAQIVELIAQGATDREIASMLRISESTAHKHVQNALRRLNARTRSQLVAAARQPVFPRMFG
jgi:DNA-binding NarL/FixJ family response regulator